MKKYLLSLFSFQQIAKTVLLFYNIHSVKVYLLYKLHQSRLVLYVFDMWAPVFPPTALNGNNLLIYQLGKAEPGFKPTTL